MGVVRYQWSENARYSVDPAPVGEAIESLGKRLGRDFEGVTAEDVVDEARSERSPLHPLFTWDDTEAAEQWRREQARCVIRSLRIVVTGPVDSEPTRIRVAVRTPSEDGAAGVRSYVPMGLAERNEMLRRQMLGDAIAGLNGWKNRYAQLQDAGKAAALIDRAIGELDRAIAKAKAKTEAKDRRPVTVA